MPLVTFVTKYNVLRILFAAGQLVLDSTVQRMAHCNNCWANEFPRTNYSDRLALSHHSSIRLVDSDHSKDWTLVQLQSIDYKEGLRLSLP